ncbi:DUF4232 domain-containing protein [Streptomyces sp. ISL-66]|uniref:DUF4232 domain-containing protein n=1 Tax=Streptomyces sp. ISL-66 TaxID=2819186 RepID=UPI001BE9159A|nr:DUF4232 domain-containing protein [Streptomyces sp. ISL-66]MBT2471312.1 DUF4232 domain-containing protein [Streptomyces sp. ISL-66]
MLKTRPTHTTRTGWKTYALGALSIAALLSSSACGPDGKDDKADPGVPSPTATASAAPGAPGPTATATPGPPTATAAPGADESRDGSGDGGRNAIASCTDANISLAATFYPQDGNRHLLLTATNTGDKACTLYIYPTVRLGAAGDPIGPLESDWHAIATIGPNEKAYSGIRLFRAGEKTDTVKSLTVAFRNRDNDSDAGKPLNVPLTTPDFLNVGPMPGVIFWNNDLRVVEKYLLAT